MTWAWKPHWSHERVNMERCRASVSAGRIGSFQCSRKGVVEEDGMRWCRQHAPSAARKRQEASDARYREERRLRQLRYDREAAHATIADTAIAYFDQQASHDDLEKAVMAWRRLDRERS